MCAVSQMGIPVTLNLVRIEFNVLVVADGTMSHLQKIIGFWMWILFCAKTAVRPL